MSDFITSLRDDLVEAAARHQRRATLARTARVVHPRAWRPGLVVTALAATTTAAAVALMLAALAPPAKRATQPRVVAVVRVGGIPVDGTLGAGSLWVADFNRAILRIDPTTQRVVARIALPTQPQSIADGPSGVWVRTAEREVGLASQGALFEVDPKINSATPRGNLGGGSGIAVGTGAVWAARATTTPSRIDRLDPRTGAPSGRVDVTDVDGVALARGTLWAIAHEGTLAQIDAASGRIVQRWPQLAPLSDAMDVNTHALAPDRASTWVVSSAKAAILRVAGGRVVQRFAVDQSVRPILARAAGGLWIVTGADVTRHSRLSRIDPETGEVTATIDLGAHRPVALLGDDRTLYAIGGDGTVVVIRG